MGNEQHNEYFISYEDKDWYWDEMHGYATGHEDLDYYVRWAEKMRAYGHRNVRVMESVVVEREVACPEPTEGARK